MNEANNTGKIIDAEVVDQMKCYMLTNERYPLTYEQGRERVDMLKQKSLLKSPGYIAVWHPDAVIMTVIHDDERGLVFADEQKRFDFNHSAFANPLDLCQTDKMLYSKELEIVKTAGTIEEYLSQFAII